MITKIQEGRVIHVGKIKKDGLAKKLNPDTQNNFYTKVRIRLNSKEKTVCLIGKIPESYNHEKISIKTSFENTDQQTTVIQEVYSITYGLSIRIREYQKKPEELPFNFD